jgi:hypothetical protein
MARKMGENGELEAGDALKAARTGRRELEGNVVAASSAVCR